MSKSTYVIDASTAVCPNCGDAVPLLGPLDGSLRKPRFYICWTCREVREVGVGLVPVDAPMG